MIPSFSYATGQSAPTLLFLAVLLLVVFIGERRSGRIPDWMTFITFAAALVRSCALVRSPVTIAAAALVGLTPLCARAATRAALGWGDVKLGISLALLLGPVSGAVALLLAGALALCGVAFGALVDPGSSYEAGFPFGPYLVAGAILALPLEALHA